MAFPLAVALFGVLPWTNGWSRRDRLRALGSLAALGAVRSALSINLRFSSTSVTAMVVTAGLFWLIVVQGTWRVIEEAPRGRRLYEGDWLDAGVLPLAFAVAAVMTLDGSTRTTGLAFVVAGVVLLATVIRFPQGSLRDAAAFVTVLCALLATLFLESGHPRAITGTLAAISALCLAANVVWSSASWTTLGMIGLAWSMIASLGQLTAREAYVYMPFGTRESAVAGAVLASAVFAWRFARDAMIERVLRAAAITWAFLWVHQEIAFAFNQTTATLLRVTYYAATSVAAVGVGRLRSVPILRHIGLALAVLAAATAL